MTYTDAIKFLGRKGTKVSIYVAAFNRHMQVTKTEALSVLRGMRYTNDDGDTVNAWGDELCMSTVGQTLYID